MKRRQFIQGASLGAVAAAASFPTPSLAQGVKELRMVTSWPKNYPGQGTAAVRFAERIAQATDGKITVKVYSAGELVPAFEVFDAVSNGTADLYHSADYYFQGKSKAFAFFTTVPYGLTVAEHNAWIYYGDGQKLWDELSGGFGIKPFIAGNTGVQMGGWFRKEMKTVDDFQGLKFRMPGIGGDVLKALGVTVVALPGGEIFPALQSGAIDGTEWVGPWNDLALGFYKVAKYYYWPGFHEPGATLSVGVNAKVWGGLSKSQQEVFRSVLSSENELLFAEFNARNGESLDTLLNKHNVQLKRFSDDILMKFGEAAGQVVAEVGNSDAQTKKVYDSFIGFRKGIMEWTKLSEQAFTGARALGFKYG
jgi:TRAP-type mannitol/chloroaromatic compound transport system substrate-binding protein